VDETGLEGTFNFELDFVPENVARALGEAGGIADALMKQLGLVLKMGKAPTEVVVVERASKLPKEN